MDILIIAGSIWILIINTIVRKYRESKINDQSWEVSWVHPNKRLTQEEMDSAWYQYFDSFQEFYITREEVILNMKANERRQRTNS